MAVLKQNSGVGSNFGPPPPAGAHIATCVKVLDQFGVNPIDIGWVQEAEKGVKTVDVTRFVFGVLGPDGKTYYVATRLMRISGNEKASLYKFLTAWTGRPPAYGRDYAAEMSADPEVGCLHRPAMISVTTTAKNDKTYADVSAVMPVPPGYTVPAVAEFAPPERLPYGPAAGAQGQPPPAQQPPRQAPPQGPQAWPAQGQQQAAPPAQPPPQPPHGWPAQGQQQPPPQQPPTGGGWGVNSQPPPAGQSGGPNGLPF